MTMTAMLYEAEDPAERRTAPRRAVGQETTVRRRGEPATVTLHDLSDTGALIETDGDLTIGTAVTIGLTGVGRFGAHVVTRAGGRYGCRFDRPLPQGATATAFAADPVIAGPFASVSTAPVADETFDKWPGLVRVALPIGLSLAGWAAAFLLAYRLAA